ncbi:MAG TPA: PTS sugar transporter subunit IIB [Candidatus Limnocylindria bacterium]|nr:PTS sugar transporter subunit IIB [Candidatus Limnocylindria bacterium]
MGLGLRLVRVDDRLIHGQVAAIWLKTVGASRIIIVDDRTARDDFLREVIELSAPAGVAVEIHDVAGGAERVKEAAAADEAAFVLMRSPVTALRLREMGVPFDVLNIGGIGAGPDRKPLYRNISASQDELEALRRLEQMGTRVELRIVANDKAVPFTSVDRG